ncbi:uncharacterized protein LOC111022144 [Momordica charantia]|uniref:Uncharacterized protein LOC111022144 n=1 Tax=Momordica charantia TaxID=3673 RepID=A0A6J1DL73_MOMCH|nr:uncharacterized protein LOC111022144 [Momordica charantia]
MAVLHVSRSEAHFIKDFKRYGPPTFDGESERATAAEEWIRELEAFYAYLGCEDQFKVKGAVFMLRGEALNWWDSIAAAEDHANVTIPWARFKDLLYDYYYLETVKDMKEAEFLHLVQGTLSVAQYERKFTELSRFALELILNAAMKIKRFVKGLSKGIRGPVDLQRPASYAEAVRGALIMDKDVSNKAPSLPEVGSSSGVKRKFHPTYADPSLRAPQHQAQHRGMPPVCPTCQKRHAGQCWTGSKGCFRCGRERHFARECPMSAANTQRLGQRISPTVSTQGNNQRARVFALTRKEAADAETVVTGNPRNRAVRVFVVSFYTIRVSFDC